MEFRPCIDIHNGKVKQIVGGSLKDEGNMADENFVSGQDAVFYANLYKKEGFCGGHIILLNARDSEYYEATKKQAVSALQAYPGGLQIGGGITAENAEEFLTAGASHVIVTSYVFCDGKIQMDRLKKLRNAVGKEHLVLDLSCRKKDGKYYIVTDRWQRFTEQMITEDLLEQLAGYCDEFLIHAVDVEGKASGIEEELVRLLGNWGKIPVTYAGGVGDFEDLARLKKLGKNMLNVTIGSDWIMSKYTNQDIIQMVEDEDVEFIRLQFTDMFGTLKNVAVTSSQLEKALNNECMFDGSSIEGFVRIEESDMYLYPDLDTFCIFPWRPQQGKVARIICDIYTADRQPFSGDPRYVLKKAVADAAQMGYQFDVGPECEFFLFDQNNEGQPTTESNERAGYFDLGPVDLGENARRDMVLTLEDMGFEIEASHHEMSPAQHEIDFRYDEALKTADNIMTFKLAVKTIAKRHGMFASFMPKPKYGINGSGMHVNMSLAKDGKNIFADPEGEMGLSKEAFWFIGGIMKHMKGMTVITNPLVNSYKRLVPGYEAPIYIAWSATNRSPLIRIPVTRGAGTRVELRCPDPAANPYLVLAVCLEAGLDGIRNQITPPDAVTENVFEMQLPQRAKLGIESLPGDLEQAVEELEKDDYIKNVLGGHITEKYLEAKKAEWADYRAQVTEWEIEKYLYKI